MNRQQQYPEHAAEGRKTEAYFRTLAEKRGFTYLRDATAYENSREHWDQAYNYKEVKRLIEIKGFKKSQMGESPDYDHVLLELHGNAFKRHAGWLYGSKADLLAFAYQHGFVVLIRQNVINFVRDKMGITGPSDPELKQKRMLSPSYWRSPHHGRMRCYQVYYRLHNNVDDDSAVIWAPWTHLLTLPHLELMP